MFMDALISTAKNIIENFLNIKKNEKVLLVCDHENRIIDSFKSVFAQEGINFKEVRITDKRADSSAIPEIGKEMLSANVIIAPTRKSITHSPETVIAKEKGAKIVTLPGITEEVFLMINKANFREIFVLAEKIATRLKNADKIRITTPRGTDISFSIKDRVWKGLEPDKTKGFISNLPIGEVFCAPIEDSANGKIVVDYWKDGISPKEDAWLEVKDGKIIRWSASAEALIKEHSVENGLIIAEFGIGLNKAHKSPIGNVLHDEKIFESVHIAFGNNVSFGGKNKSNVHNDIILVSPSVFFDGKKLVWE